MCGICGFVGKGTPKDIEAMTKTLAHRGPDDLTTWHNPQKAVFLGHSRLAIMDQAGGAQPMWSADKTLSVVFNGEIYNHLELRQQLQAKGYNFVTDHCDTEVLLYGYREWGHNLPEKLNGMWAFAIYDHLKDILFLSRDRFGQKPLFYTRQGNTFAFASELTPFKSHPQLATNLKTLSLKKYFAYGFIPAPHTIYENVYKLPAGCNLVFSGLEKKLHQSRYWSYLIEPFKKIPKRPEEEWGEQLRHLLFQAVKRQLMSDVPLGVFLSGGIDSAAIISLCVSASLGKPINTFSIGFEEKSFDESGYSTEIARILGTNHYHNVLSLEKALKLTPTIAARLDEPMGDSSLIASFLLCQKAKEHVSVALGGDGADELFAGYDPFKALKLAKLYSRLFPKPVHSAIKLLATATFPVSHQNMSLNFKLKKAMGGLDFEPRLWNPVWLGPLNPGELEELFNEPADLEEIYEEAIKSWENCRQDNIVDRTMQFYTDLYLQDDILVKMDRAGMLNSLEVRSPFLDLDFVDFVRKIPNEFKFRNNHTKYILKEALQPVLPVEILQRPKKGFGVPMGKWFKAGNLPLDMDALNPCRMQKKYLEKLYQDHLTNKSDNRAALWSSWLLSAWLR